MKKGTFMNEKEWLDYFETINNRKPTEEEIQQAKKLMGNLFLKSLRTRVLIYRKLS